MSREFGSEFPEIVLPDGFYESFGELGDTAFVRSGREALALCARSVERHSGVALLPALSCESMIRPFELNGFEVVYYRLDRNLSVDCEYLGKVLREVNPDIVLTMNYFGLADTSACVGTVKEYSADCVIVEDFSHCLFSLPAIFDDRVDYYAASLRKSLGINDGGVVISKRYIDRQCIGCGQTGFVVERAAAQAEKSLYGYTKDPGLKSSFRSRLSQAEHELDGVDRIYAISDASLARLRQVNSRHIARVRRENYIHLRACLADAVGIEFIGNGAVPEAPFSLPVLVRDQAAFQNSLGQRGVYAPVLWPIRDAQAETCANSKYFSDHMLSVPVDQRYDYDDMIDIASVVMEVDNI